MWSAGKGSANKDVHRNAGMGRDHPSCVKSSMELAKAPTPLPTVGSVAAPAYGYAVETERTL
jgi:hypothetical protein